MTYFDCFVVGAWTFAFGWFFGAIYVQNQNEKVERPLLLEEAEQSSEYEAWGLSTAASASAD